MRLHHQIIIIIADSLLLLLFVVSNSRADVNLGDNKWDYVKTA